MTFHRHRRPIAADDDGDAAADSWLHESTPSHLTSDLHSCSPAMTCSQPWWCEPEMRSGQRGRFDDDAVLGDPEVTRRSVDYLISTSDLPVVVAILQFEAAFRGELHCWI